MQRSPEGAAINYYERHLGDYARDTAHLTMVEHGAYTLLLDRYYATQAPIPTDQAHRLTRARTREERAAVDAVLAEFFTESPEGWRHSRCDAEIARFLETEPEREQKRENAKERQRRARDRRRELFEELRGHGIVPPFDATTTALQKELARVTGAKSHAPVTRDNTATQHQSPVTSHQLQVTDSSGSECLAVGAQPDESARSPAGEACRAMRDAGMPPHLLNPAHPGLVAALADGAGPAEFGATAAELIARRGGVPPMAYVVSTVIGRRRDAAARPKQPANGVAASFDGKTYTGATDDELEAFFGRA